MASEYLQELLINVAYTLDQASKSKMMDQVAKAMGDIEEEENKGGKARLTTRQKLGAALAEVEKHASAEMAAQTAAASATQAGVEAKFDKRRVDTETKAAAKREKAAKDEVKRNTERRSGEMKEIEAFGLRITAVSSGIVKAVGAAFGGASLGAFGAGIASAAQSYSKLQVQSQRVGASPQSIKAYEYAMERMGVDKGEATSSLEGFAEQFRNNPQGFANLIEGMGVRTTQNGHQRDVGAVLEDLGKAFQGMDYNLAKIRASQIGIGENPLIALRNNAELQAGVARYNAKAGTFGVDNNEAAQQGREFVKAYDDMSADMALVMTKLETVFFKPLTAAMKEVSALLEQNPKLVEGVGAGFVAMSALMTARVVPVLLRVTGLMSTLAAVAPPAWLLRFLGVGGAVAAVMAPTPANGDEPQIGPDGQMSYTIGGKPATKEQYLAAHTKDTRSWYEKMLPTWAGGKDAPTADVPGGGSGGGAGGTSPVSQDIPKEGRALLDTLASGEAPAYNVMNGGARFSDMSQHPGGRAAGRYQFLPSTWRGIVEATGLKDFGPESQDKGAWFLAQRDYRARTGRDLTADLKSNDPSILSSIGRSLHPTWVSLNDSFSGKYQRFLGRDGQAAASPPPSPAPAPIPPSTAPMDSGGQLPGGPVLSNYMSKNGMLTDADKERYETDRIAYWEKLHSQATEAPKQMPSLADLAKLNAGHDAFQKQVDGARADAARAAMFSTSPLGVSPTLLHQIDNSKGDTNHTFTQNVTVNGVQKPDEVASHIKVQAQRGGKDLLRNIQGNSQ